MYIVTYIGNNLNDGSLIYQTYQNNPNIEYNILSLSTQNNIASYYINITDNLLNNSWDYLGKASGIEFALSNYSSNDVTIKSITVHAIESCQNS